MEQTIGQQKGLATGYDRRLTRRHLSRILAGAAPLGMLPAVVACGASTAAPVASKGPVTVTYMSNLPETHPEGAARLYLLDEFNKTNEQKTTVNVNEGKAATTLEKYKALAAGGTPPDLAYLAFYHAADLFAAGSVVDVDAELKSDKDWAKQRADLYPAMLESSTWTGKLVSIPMYTNNVAMIYNTGLLQQAGVTAPKQGWTWDDFKSTAPRLAKPGNTVLSLGWFSWAGWLGSMGSQIFSKDAKKVTADTPEMLQLMELWLGFIKNGLAPADGKTELYREARNDIAFEVQGPYRIPTLRQVNAPPFEVVHIPVHPVKKQITAANGGHNVAIFKDIPTERRQGAAQLVKWLNSPASQAQMCIRATSLPVSKSALGHKDLQEYLKTDAQLKGFIDLAPYGWRAPALPSYEKVNKALQDNFNALLKQEIGVKDGLAKAQREAQVFLDDDVKLMA